MRFTESRKRTPWVLLILLIIVVGVLALGFCQFEPVPKTIQKNIVYEAD